ncbi:hypothetical protein GCM10010340_11810 [Streptomyces griseoloalbus]|nr:hypothetical protein GCM10010340_11810 [Streptomyces albaduncus]
MKTQVSRCSSCRSAVTRGPFRRGPSRPADIPLPAPALRTVTTTRTRRTARRRSSTWTPRVAPGGLFAVIELADHPRFLPENAPEDLTALDRLLDTGGPHSVLRRDDLTVRTVWAARRT